MQTCVENTNFNNDFNKVGSRVTVFLNVYSDRMGKKIS